MIKQQKEGWGEVVTSFITCPQSEEGNPHTHPPPHKTGSATQFECWTKTRRLILAPRFCMIPHLTGRSDDP